MFLSFVFYTEQEKFLEFTLKDVLYYHLFSSLVLITATSTYCQKNYTFYPVQHYFIFLHFRTEDEICSKLLSNRHLLQSFYVPALSCNCSQSCETNAFKQQMSAGV